VVVWALPFLVFFLKRCEFRVKTLFSYVALLRCFRNENALKNKGFSTVLAPETLIVGWFLAPETLIVGWFLAPETLIVGHKFGA
jgi:hypothetical protein